MNSYGVNGSSLVFVEFKLNYQLAFSQKKRNVIHLLTTYEVAAACNTVIDVKPGGSPENMRKRR